MSTSTKTKPRPGKATAAARSRKTRNRPDGEAGAAVPDGEAPVVAPVADDAGASVVLEHDLTIHHAQAAHQVLCRWNERGLSDIDLAAVQECDSTGVQLLLAARRSAAAAGRSLRLLHAGAGVLDALARFGLDAQLQHRVDAGV